VNTASLHAADQRDAPARVMVCDDSVAIRGAISRMLESDPAINVVARVANGQAAIEQLRRTPADVVVLDIEMPVMDGLAALPLLLKQDPELRVIIASTLTMRGADTTLRALRLGAADYLPKPSSVEATADEGFRRDLLEKVKVLARRRKRGSMAAAPVGQSSRPAPRHRPRLLAIGSSTGGPQALFTLVKDLGLSVNVPVVMTQHMPASFTPLLAAHINRLGFLPCAEAQDQEPLRPGRIYLAPGDRHLIVEGPTCMLRARLSSAPPENFCRPSVDPMLRSAAAATDGRVLVAMLTGMGHDGLAGTRAVVDAGGAAIAQDADSSIVWGMPGAIAQAGLCHAILPLHHMAAKLIELLHSARQ
jgi:two-component system chemotaxis response regulator CheB